MINQVFVEIFFGVAHGRADFYEPRTGALKAHPLHRSNGQWLCTPEIPSGAVLIE
jgi:hypothetical protein